MQRGREGGRCEGGGRCVLCVSIFRARFCLSFLQYSRVWPCVHAARMYCRYSVSVRLPTCVCEPESLHMSAHANYKSKPANVIQLQSSTHGDAPAGLNREKLTHNKQLSQFRLQQMHFVMPESLKKIWNVTIVSDTRLQQGIMLLDYWGVFPLTA